MKIVGCGDVFITRRLPKTGYSGFDEIANLVQSHDVCFSNLEVSVLNRDEGYPSNSPGGGWAITQPDSLSDIKRFGFNIFSIGNNHSLDFCRNGLLATIKNLSSEGFQYVGAGRDLLDASRPKYIECADRSRVAVIGITSSFNTTDSAGYAGRAYLGRPGVNPLRRKEIYELVPDSFDNLKRIINEIQIKETYNYPSDECLIDDSFSFRGISFFKGKTNRRITKIDQGDLKRTIISIEEAKTQSDCVIISFHSHQFSGEYEKPRDFILEFCHQCIDAGADVVFGHGVHTMRGVEIYKGKPIFYGLGDFIFQNDMMDTQPYEFYKNYNTEIDYLDCVGIAMNKRSLNETKGLNADPRTWEGMIASVEFNCGTIKGIKLYPVDLGFQKGRIYRGWPVIDETGRVIKRLSDISKKHFGTNISLDGCIGSIEIKK